EYMRLMKEQGITITKDDIAPGPSEDRKRKRVVKERGKIDDISESDKVNVAKKQRTQKKTTKVVRKLVIHEVDDEETEEEPLISKRKRSEPETKEMNTEANA
ncbi:hypothetical protein A2U01_0064531, partial [Trifolium medium]|nr:hypothetical protein [Trifolium medium]